MAPGGLGQGGNFYVHGVKKVWKLALGAWRLVADDCLVAYGLESIEDGLVGCCTKAGSTKAAKVDVPTAHIIT